MSTIDLVRPECRPDGRYGPHHPFCTTDPKLAGEAARRRYDEEMDARNKAAAFENRIKASPVPDWLDLGETKRPRQTYHDNPLPAVKPPSRLEAQPWALDQKRCTNGDCDIIGTPSQVAELERTQQAVQAARKEAAAAAAAEKKGLEQLWKGMGLEF